MISWQVSTVRAGLAPGEGHVAAGRYRVPVRRRSDRRAMAPPTDRTLPNHTPPVGPDPERPGRVVTLQVADVTAVPDDAMPRVIDLGVVEEPPGRVRFGPAGEPVTMVEPEHGSGSRDAR